MQVSPIFSVGVGVEECPEGVSFGKQLFLENKDLFKKINGKEFNTTLYGYRRAKNTPEYQDSESLNFIQNLIVENAKKYFESCGYDSERHDFILNDLWLNEMMSGSDHSSHAHYGFQISGCFYVEVPEGSGKIVFTTPISNAPYGRLEVRSFEIYNSLTWSFDPKPGEMYFWRSDLKHEVPSGDFEGVRRSIAFDINVAIKE